MSSQRPEVARLLGVPQADRGLSALRHWPRQRIHHSRKTYDFPDDFPQRLVRFKEESGLLWAELNRRLGTHPYTMRRWVKGRVRPSMRHMMALLDLAEDLGLAHLFTE